MKLVWIIFPFLSRKPLQNTTLALEIDCNLKNYNIKFSQIIQQITVKNKPFKNKKIIFSMRFIFILCQESVLQ